MILVDTNILMYAAGGDHQHKDPSVALLNQIAKGGVEACINTEVLQEILHRYRKIRRWSEGRRLFDETRRIVPAVWPITVEVVDTARLLMDEYSTLGARDALHAAVVFEHDLAGICSYDCGFDVITALHRMEPQGLTE